jgi:hypothetical protein
MSFVTTKKNKTEYYKEEDLYLVRFARHNRDDKIKDKMGDTCSMHVGTETVLCTTFQLKRPLRIDYSRDNRHKRVNIIKNILTKYFLIYCESLKSGYVAIKFRDKSLDVS